MASPATRNTRHDRGAFRIAEVRTLADECTALLGQLATKPKLKQAGRAARDAILLVTSAQEAIAAETETQLNASAPGINALVDQAVDQKAKSIAPGGNLDRERAALRRTELQTAIAGVQATVVERERARIAELAKTASEKCYAFVDAFEAARAADRLPVALRAGSTPTLAVASLMRVSELRAHANACDPSTLRREWQDLELAGDDETRALFCYVCSDICRDIIRKGAVAFKQAAPKTATGKADAELRAAHALLAATATWQHDNAPAWITVAEQLAETLKRAFRVCCGLDVKAMSREEFRKLYLGNNASTDPTSEPFRVATPESIIGRFQRVPALLE